MDFNKFKLPVAKQFEKMAKHPLFRVDLDGDTLWSTYLSSFPPGTNPIFRERAEYDCSCCRQFIRAVGNVVAIVNDEIVSVWDIVSDEPAFQTVANAMSTLVKSRGIGNAFLNREPKAGVDKNFEEMVDRVLTWNHFFVNIPAPFVCRGPDIGPRLSETRALHDVLYRSLQELTDDAVDTVLELIGQNSLYRGEEHKFALETFCQLKRDYARLGDDQQRHTFVWARIGTIPASVSKIRNTAIGTLLVDLSEGMELEAAVRRFESVVAPTNYRRPTALVTPKMVEAAKKTLTDLGLMSALQRRYARLEDLSVNDILFADRSARAVIEPDVFQTLSAMVPPKKQNFDKVEEITIDRFIAEVVPRAESIEALFENRHAGNLVSLIAPADPTANALFKWDNHFSWSYQGDLADSIKERVKQAGGNVTGDLCCRLAWHNHDDLDLHMIEPGRYEIYYVNKRTLSPSGGMLDVDMNVGSLTRTPVENIFYTSRKSMREGVYELYVHNFNRRESVDVGFEVEFDWLGTVHRFEYAKPVRDRECITVARLKYSAASGIEIIESLPSSQASRTLWGLNTHEFQRVNVITLSPNHWGARSTGNKHYFFFLAECQNDGEARGFFNEFLKEELTPHRKVIEMVGARMKTAADPHQLSGLGFSSTQRNDVLVRIKGSFNRTVKVVF